MHFAARSRTLLRLIVSALASCALASCGDGPLPTDASNRRPDATSDMGSASDAATDATLGTDGTPGDGAMTCDPAFRCGAECCRRGQVCGGGRCCAPAERCGAVCCSEGHVCREGFCERLCGTDPPCGPTGMQVC